MKPCANCGGELGGVAVHDCGHYLRRMELDLAQAKWRARWESGVRYRQPEDLKDLKEKIVILASLIKGKRDSSLDGFTPHVCEEILDYMEKEGLLK